MAQNPRPELIAEAEKRFYTQRTAAFQYAMAEIKERSDVLRRDLAESRQQDAERDSAGGDMPEPDDMSDEDKKAQQRASIMQQLEQVLPTAVADNFYREAYNTLMVAVTTRELMHGYDPHLTAALAQDASENIFAVAEAQAIASAHHEITEVNTAVTEGFRDMFTDPDLLMTAIGIHDRRLRDKEMDMFVVELMNQKLDEMKGILADIIGPKERLVTFTRAEDPGSGRSSPPPPLIGRGH